MNRLSRTGHALRTLGVARAFAAGMLAIMATGLWVSSATAQGNDLCTACVASSGCDTAQQGCVAECRAQFFEIDPRRSRCTEQCSATASQCVRQAKSTCRTKNACR